jgi:chromosome partitioning protein
VALPIEPSGASAWASDLTVKQVQQAQDLKPTLKCGFVVSRKLGNTVIGRDIRNMTADLGIPVLNTDIESRVAYAESLTMGKTIFEWSPNSPATKEIETLTQEIMNHVQEDVFDSTQTKTAHG